MQSTTPRALTKKAAATTENILAAWGGVVLELSHLCMVMRGMEETTSATAVSSMLGCFRARAWTGEEFLRLVVALSACWVGELLSDSRRWAVRIGFRGRILRGLEGCLEGVCNIFVVLMLN